YPEAHARPAPRLSPQRGADPSARAALLPRPAAHPRDRGRDEQDLADDPTRARAYAPGRVPRLRRPRAPAHRNHPGAARDPARAHDRRASTLPRDRARQDRVGTTRLPPPSRKPARDARSRLPLIYKLSNSGPAQQSIRPNAPETP